MEIYKNIKIEDLCLLIDNETLVVGDLHLGFEESLNKQGVLIPRIQFTEVMKRLSMLLKKLKPKKVIIVGDVKHEFGTISNQEWNNILKVFKLIKEYSELIIIKGNHDTILKPITEKENINILDEYWLNDIQFLHGDIIPKKLGKLIIMGHEHPAIKFKERPTEKFKCFLKGKYKTHELIVMPSFNFISLGSDITKNQLLSPFLKKADLNNFEVYVIEDKPYYFGKIKDLE